MVKLTNSARVSLKNHPEIKEAAIQQFIFDNPAVLGLGDLSPIRREKIQPSGGRLDLLLGDDDTRYEVEIQLGATDPSHIIRTIEYWDMEKKRYPQYNHCAVIIAEEITSRFMNVISLFNGAIPLIAIQLSATMVGNDISLNFVKVLDRNDYGSEEENDVEPTDRKYWEGKSKVLSFVDEIFTDVSKHAPGFELKYNKFYIGLAQNGSATNFVYFKPKQRHIYMYIAGKEETERTEALENTNLEFDYRTRSHCYRIKISRIGDYQVNKELLENMIRGAMEYRNVNV